MNPRKGNITRMILSLSFKYLNVQLFWKAVRNSHTVVGSMSYEWDGMQEMGMKESFQVGKVETIFIKKR